MINRFSLAKALYDNAKLVCDNNNYTFITKMQDYERDPNSAYVSATLVYGTDNTIGLADCSSDIQLGFYQIDIYTPKANEGCEWQGLAMSDILQTGFKKGTELTNNDQMARIKNTSSTTLDYDDTHLITILSVYYSIIS